ncbi:male sterility protein-domain-containing protein [Amylostereum chailletii]|nr:male sterility protein-domain-containing protein [Amylostereum chailletii]
MQRLSQATAEILAKDGIHFETLAMPLFEDLYNENEELEDAEPRPLSPDHPVLILHTSGAFLLADGTHSAMADPYDRLDGVAEACSVYEPQLRHVGLHHGEVDFGGARLAVHTMPMFHAMGAVQLVWTVCAGNTLVCYRPSSPPVFPTPETFLADIVATSSEIAWARSGVDLDRLKCVKAILFGGAPMNKKVGDDLMARGLKLFTFYGLTEAGSIAMVIPAEATGEFWEYFKLSPHLTVELVPQEGMDGIVELVILKGPMFSPNITNTVVGGVSAYATNDLLQAHPTQPGYWRIFGRADDQLALSTGEKTNPGPLESTIMQDPHINVAVMFGRGRFQNGILVEPKVPFDPSDVGKLAQFRNNIWPSVQRANEFAPAHSRIFKEMIIVSKPEKPMELTPKGTPRRHVCIAAYEQEIEELYQAVKESSNVEYPPPDVWTMETSRDFVRTSIRRITQAPFGDDADIYQNGCDSLQATWIRNTLMHALRTSTTANLHDVPHNFVYAHPTVNSLGEYVYSVASQQHSHANDEETLRLKVRAMHDMVSKYSAGIGALGSQALAANGHAPYSADGEVVLLTGSTGRLGCHLLSLLVADPAIEHVFALNREASQNLDSLKSRQEAALKMWGLDSRAVMENEGKVTLLAGDLAKEGFGLDVKMYDQLSKSVTSIVHNAWRVDFNVQLATFEPLISGLRRIIDLAARSPAPGGARILFVSSISVVLKHPSPVPEVPVVDGSVAAGFGYGESKWVAEQLLFRARSAAGLNATVVRVGQLSGDTTVGAWNTKEWVPALVSLGKAVGALPARAGPVSWIPVDVAAKALMEMRRSNQAVLHLVSPTPAAWNTLFSTFARLIAVPLLPQDEWNARARAAAAEAAQVEGARAGPRSSALSLLAFFEGGRFGEDAVLSTRLAVDASRTLADVRTLGPTDAEMYVRHWQSVGFLTP